MQEDVKQSKAISLHPVTLAWHVSDNLGEDIRIAISKYTPRSAHYLRDYMGFPIIMLFTVCFET